MATSREFPGQIKYQGIDYENWQGLMDDQRLMPEPGSPHTTVTRVDKQWQRKGLVRFQRREDDPRPELRCTLKTDAGRWKEVADENTMDWDVPFEWDRDNELTIIVEHLSGD